MKLAYLLINFSSVIVPFIFSFHSKIKFNKEYRYFWPANLAVALFFIVWDVLFTGLKVWGFNPKYTTGLYVFNLPVEEILFFICIPYACVFSYHCIRKFYLKSNTYTLESSVTPILILMLLSLATIFIDRLYTSVTFIFLAGSLFYLKYILKVRWLGGFFISYSFLLLPFLLVNGILTGTFLEEPIVWYDNTNNIGIRILTIPFEDIFYGMLLVLLNIALYNLLKDNAFKKTQHR